MALPGVAANAWAPVPVGLSREEVLPGRVREAARVAVAAAAAVAGLRGAVAGNSRTLHAHI